MLMEFMDLVDAGASYTLRHRPNLQLSLRLPVHKHQLAKQYLNVARRREKPRFVLLSLPKYICTPLVHILAVSTNLGCSTESKPN
jgi:hypothetical protein